MSLSGIHLVYYQDLGLSKEIRHNLKDVYEIMFSLIRIFIIIHIIGLVISENKDKKAVVLRMIYGRD